MSASKESLGSDLRKADLYENTEADYAELPEVTDEEFARGEWRVAGRPVRGRPPLGARTKQLLSLRLDPEIQARFRSSGPGWQARMNTFLSHNEAILKMIVDFDEAIGDMTELIKQLRAGGLVPGTGSIEASIQRVERTIALNSNTVLALRAKLVWEQAEAVG